MKASSGRLADNKITWSYTPDQNENGTITLDYLIKDGHGGEFKASNSFELEAVNDAPIVSGPVDLGAIDEDGAIRVTKEQLLKNSFDVDGDALSIKDLKLSKGAGALSANNDGSWTFTPAKDWNGQVELNYNVSDKSKLLSAGSLIASGDDNYSIYLNGHLIGSGEGWQKAEEWNVDIKNGRNSIVIAAHNNANGTHPGAAIASLKIGSTEI